MRGNEIKKKHLDDIQNESSEEDKAWDSFLKEAQFWIDNDILPSRKLMYLGSEGYVGETESGVDFLMAKKAIKNLFLLDAIDQSKPITIIMNNPGGSFYDGMAIYSAIKQCKSDINIMVYGRCFSMASIILQAADKRYFSKDSRMMIHDGEDGYYGHPKNTEAWARQSSKMRKEVYEIFKTKMKNVLRSPSLPEEVLRILKHHGSKISGKGFSIYEVEEMFHDDLVLTAKEAKRIGLADEIF